jgi:hypothetical protein
MVKVDDKRKPEKSSSTKQFPKRLYASITVGKQLAGEFSIRQWRAMLFHYLC